MTVDSIEAMWLERKADGWHWVLSELRRVRALTSKCAHEWRLAEDGYTRTWGTTIGDDGTIYATFRGTEDWSEDGDGNLWLECGLCLTREAADGDKVWWD